MTLPTPTLLVNGSSNSLMVGWQPIADPPVRYRYQLHLSMVRPGGSLPLQVTKQVFKEHNTFLWQDLAADARYCFRLGATLRREAHVAEGLLSDETCYSSCGCDASSALHSSYAGTNCSNCTLSMLWSAAFTIMLTLAVCGFCMLTGWHSLFARHFGDMRRGQDGDQVCSAYSHLTKNDAVAELEPRSHRVQKVGFQLDADRFSSTNTLSLGAANRQDHAELLLMLEPYPIIDATAFEREWVQCQGRSCTIAAPVCSGSLPSADKTELALAHSGLVCIAIGAIDQVHKSYFAAQLRESREWLMLELVVFSDRGRVQGTFRAKSDSMLPVLVDHFTAVLNQALGAQFARSEVVNV